MSNIFAEVSPNPLEIDLSRKDTGKKKSSLIIKNLTNKYILYKFLINTRGILLAKPPTSFIKPNQSISIEIDVLNHNLPIEDYHKTKLLLMFIKCNEEIKTIEQAKKKFQELKNEKNDETEKQETLINLNVISDEEQLNKMEEKITYINYAQLKAELKEKNEEIRKNLEMQRKKLENLVIQEKKYNNKGSRSRTKNYNIDSLIFAFIILIGLIIGANFAYGYNKLFKK